MEIMRKMKKKTEDLWGSDGVTIAFLGDSVTQGCFEPTPDYKNPVFDKSNTYHAHLAKALELLYPSVPVNIINAGISGDNAPHGYARLEHDVLRHEPDLAVICYGLNDAAGGLESIGEYTCALAHIFQAVQERGVELIFMTPNMCNDRISPYVENPDFLNFMKCSMERQNGGVMDAYMDAARETCKKYGVRICDCYAKWKKLQAVGINITELLANKANHPTREMNWLFAVSLLETMLED